TTFRLISQSLLDETIYRWRDRLIVNAQRLVASDNGSTTRQTLVQKNAEGKDVAGRRDFLAAFLFGRHVSRSPDRGTSRHARQVILAKRDSKVHEVAGTHIRRQDDIRRFDIAVNHAVIMSVS